MSESLKAVLKRLLLALALSPILSFGFLFSTALATNVGGIISQNTTWTLANSPYVVTSTVTVNSGITLTIEPGVIVKFQSQKGLTINGSLLADATPTDRIVFTSYKDDLYGGDTNGDGSLTQPAKSDWSQISFSSSSTNSTMDFCIVKYSGYLSYGIYGSIRVLCPNLTLTNNTIETNTSFAVYIGASTSLTKYGNTASDNIRNGIFVQNFSTVSANTTWQGSDIPFIAQYLTIGQNKTLSIDPGVVVKSEMNSDITVNGSLFVNGNVSERVVFTSIRDDEYGGDTNNNGSASQPAKGDWQYIRFNDSSGDATSKLDFTTIRYGGYMYGSICYSSASAPLTNSIIDKCNYGTYLTGASQPAITGNSFYASKRGINASATTGQLDISGNSFSNSTSTSEGSIYLYNVSGGTISGNTITNNANGIFATGTTVVTTSGNTISNNTRAPIVMDGNSIVTVSGNTVQGNVYNGIELSGHRTLNTTIPRQEMVYVVNQFDIDQGATVTIAPGSVIKLLGTFSCIPVYGTLLAEGNAENPIVFTSIKDDLSGGDTNGDGSSTSPSPGNWFYITVYNTGSSTRFTNVRVMYGGYGSGDYYAYGALSINHSSPIISNCQFLNNEYSGIQVFWSDAAPTITNCNFESNGDGISLMLASGIVQNNNINGSCDDGIYANQSTTLIMGNNISNNNDGIDIWANSGNPYPMVSGNVFSGNADYDLGFLGTLDNAVAIGNSWGNHAYRVGEVIDDIYAPHTPAAYPFSIGYFAGAYRVSSTKVNDGSFSLGPDGCDLYGYSWLCGNSKEPVNTATGNYFSQHTDVEIPGNGLPLKLARTYNAQDIYHLGAFGYGWTHSYEQSLYFHSNGDITVRLGDGKQQKFVYNSVSNSYTSPTSVFEKLVRNQDGTYSYVFKDQSKLNFNAYGRLTSTTDRRGTSNTLTYTGSLLTSVTDASGRSLTLTYANNKISQVADPLGRTLSFTYDTNGDLVSGTDARGGVTHYTYSNHRMTSITDPEGQVFINNTYDGQGRVSEQLDGVNGLTTFSYDTVNHRTTMIDAKGHQTIHQYDGQKRLTSEIDGLGGTTSYTYDTRGSRNSTTDKNGNTTTSVFDNNGNPTSMTDPQENQTLLAYNGTNDLLSKTDALGNHASYVYDSSGNLLDVTDPLGNETTFTYNSFGKPLTITSALGNITTFVYDSYGNQTSSTDPLNNQTNYTYDLVGRKIQTTDPLGHTTQYGYDGNDNLTSVLDAASNTSTYTYDANDLLLNVTDPNGNTTSYAYDSMDHLTSVADPLNNTTSYTYDGAYNKASMTDANGSTTNYTYDAADRLVAEDFASGTDTTYTYDAEGNKLAMTDATGLTAFTYDSLNRLISTTNSAGETVSYTYDAVGRRSSMTTPQGNTTYNFGPTGNLLWMTDPNQQTTYFDYNDIGQRTRTTYPNGVHTDSTYDAAGNLTSLQNKKSTDEVISSFTYTYNADGERTNMTESDGSTTSYQYDELHRLTHEEKTDSGQNVIYRNTYTFDPAGNRLSKTDKDSIVVSYTYDAANRIETAGDDTYAHDSNGNMTGKTDNQGTTTYAYDLADHLTNAITPSGTTGFIYTGDGMRRSKTTGTDTANYLYDGISTIRETNGLGATIADYTNNPTALVGQITSRTDASDATSFYSYDGLGSTRNLTDQTQNQISGYSYDAFGNVLDHTGDNATCTFSTKEQDSTDLYYFAARYYDPETGRFTTQDPYPANLFDPKSLNRYVYCENDPINFVDPLGLKRGKCQRPNIGNYSLEISALISDIATLWNPYFYPIGVGLSVADSGLTSAQYFAGSATATDFWVSWASTGLGLIPSAAVPADVVQIGYNIGASNYWW